MKRITVVFISVLFASLSYGQVRSAGDIDTLSQWRVDFTQADSYGVVYDHYKCFIEGDTIIDSIKYYKVYKSGYWYEWLFSGSISDDYYYSHAFMGCLREQDDIWYSINYFTGELDILYDFTVEVGDTIHGTGGQLFVTAIDTIMVNGNPKKQFILNDYNGPQYIIEDIGASSGLFEPMIFFENSSELHCYAIDFVPVWINPEGFGCNLSVGIKEKRNQHKISISPNPFTTYTTLSFRLFKPENVHFTIYNVQGQIVYQMQEKQEAGEQQIKWNAHGLPAGMYFYRLKAGDRIASGKLVVRD